MLDFLIGYRTYLTIIAMVVHRILVADGIDIPSEQLSITIDVLLGILAAYFRMIANKRRKVMGKKLQKQIQKKKGVKKGLKAGVVALFVVLAMSTMAMAAEFKWSDSYEVKDNISISYGKHADASNEGSAGVYLGSLGCLKTDNGYAPVCFGGVGFNANEQGNMLINAVLFTFFNSTVQVGASLVPDKNWNDTDNYVVNVGISLTDVFERLRK